MSMEEVSVVLAHGAWADGSSWAQVISPVIAAGHEVFAAPLPLTSFDADVAALERTLERAPGPILLVAHAYAGAVIGAARNERVRALVYVQRSPRIEVKRLRTCSIERRRIPERPNWHRTATV